MECLPQRLARAYATMYADRQTQQFESSEASKILAIQDETRLAETLTELEVSGCLVARRDSADHRRKLFRLVDPVSMTLAYAIQSRAKSADVVEKLRSATGSLQYYANGSYAAHQYHHYSGPRNVELSVKADQVLVWVALLSAKDASISVNEIPAERASAVNVRLRTDFDPIIGERGFRLIEGVRYIWPEIIIARGLSETGFSLEDAVAVFLVQMKNLDWNHLFAFCLAYGTGRYLGFVSEVLNLESGRALIDPKMIAAMPQYLDFRPRLDFPASKKGEPEEEAYREVSSRWNLALHVGRAFFSKIVADLVRARAEMTNGWFLGSPICLALAIQDAQSLRRPDGLRRPLADVPWVAGLFFRMEFAKTKSTT